MAKIELRKEWETQVAAFKASGLSVPAWCRAHDVKPHRLRYWLRKFQTEVEGASSTKWVSLEVEKPTVLENAILVRVGSASIEVKPGFDATLLSDVVKILKTLC